MDVRNAPFRTLIIHGGAVLVEFALRTPRKCHRVHVIMVLVTNGFSPRGRSLIDAFCAAGCSCCALRWGLHATCVTQSRLLVVPALCGPMRKFSSICAYYVQFVRIMCLRSMFGYPSPFQGTGVPATRTPHSDIAAFVFLFAYVIDWVVGKPVVARRITYAPYSVWLCAIDFARLPFEVVHVHLFVPVARRTQDLTPKRLKSNCFVRHHSGGLPWKQGDVLATQDATYMISMCDFRFLLST